MCMMTCLLLLLCGYTGARLVTTVIGYSFFEPDSSTTATVARWLEAGNERRQLRKAPWHPIRDSQLMFTCEKNFPRETREIAKGKTQLPERAKQRTLVVVICALRAGSLTWPSFSKYMLADRSDAKFDLALVWGVERAKQRSST